MRVLKALFLPVLLICSLIGFDTIHAAAGDLIGRGTTLADLRLGSAEDDHSLLQMKYHADTGKAFPLKVIVSGQ